MERLLILTIFLSVGAVGCQRKSADDRTTISIQAPQAENRQFKTGGIGALSVMPSDRKACYGVNVTGTGIPTQQGSSCSPVSGVLGGFVEPGGNIEVEVPKGSGRKIELYAYLQGPGENVACPQLVPTLSTAQLQHTYLIGTANDIDANSDVVTVNITASFPGLNTNLAQQLSLPATCAPVIVENPPHSRISNGRQIASSAGYKLIGNIGRPVKSGSATAGTIKLISE